jgi:hypothetical protein
MIGARTRWLGSRGGRLPLRPADRLWEDLWIDPEDWADDLLPAVAGRAGYSLQQAESNRLFGRVQTVGDLAKFITLQPKICNGANGPQQVVSQGGDLI